MEKRNHTIQYFTRQIARCKQLEQELRSDDRADEAVFTKVQGNVYDIFHTVFSVAVKNAGQDDEKVVQFFLTKLDQIPQSWHTALARAEQYGKSEKAHIERLKLETAAEIKAAFEKIWEETT